VTQVGAIGLGELFQGGPYQKKTLPGARLTPGRLLFLGGGVLHVDMFANKKSGNAYQDRKRRPEIAANHERDCLGW
jgi:hypothetical protein